MRRVMSVFVFSAALLVGCASGVTDGSQEESDVDFQDALDEAASSGRCVDAELQSNMPWQDYKTAFIGIAESTDAEEVESAYQMLDATLADIYAQTPEGGQGEYARDACGAMIQFSYPGQVDVEMGATRILAPGYTVCLTGPSATSPVESIIKPPAAGSDLKSSVDLNLTLLELAKVTAALSPQVDAAFAHLCPQIEHGLADPDRAEKINALYEQVAAQARDLGICGKIDLGELGQKRVYVHSGEMPCDRAEEMMSAGFTGLQTAYEPTFDVDGGQCTGVSAGEYHVLDFDYSYTCYTPEGVVIGLSAD